MLEGYEKLSNGVIKEINPAPFLYDQKYAGAYNDLGEKGRNMGWLRLGHLIGAIGKVPDSLMDVGYGNGDFLRAAKEIIPECYGHDVSDYPVPEGVKFIDYYNWKFKQVEVMTFYDCLEHFDEISWVASLDVRFLVITVPNCHSPEDDEWFKNWKHRKKSEHIHHFNKESLWRFMQSMGYRTIMISDVEDSIRKGVPTDHGVKQSNIITGIFKKIGGSI